MNEKITFLANGTEDDFDIYLDGDMLSTDSASKLEETLTNHPSIVNLRLQLLFYYSQTAGADSSLWVKHLKWMIENRPNFWINSNIAFAPAVTAEQFSSLIECWQQQIKLHPLDPTIVGGAGEFCCYWNFELAKDLLRHAIELEPGNLRWRRAIVNNNILHFYRAEVCSKQEIDALFEDAESLLAIEDDGGKIYGLLVELCNITFQAHHIERANKFTRQLIEFVSTEREPHRMIIGWSLLGRAALLENNIAVAKAALLSASEFGYFPTFELAADLLRRGERELVLTYLKVCLPVSGNDQNTLAQWIRQLEAGSIPLLVIKAPE
jgi:hypothetical protein